MNIDKETARKIWTDARSKFDKIPYRVDADFEVYWMEQQRQAKNYSTPNVENRRKLLNGFASKFNEGLDKGDGIAIMDWMIDEFLEKEEESEDGFWDERCENERKDWNE